MQNKKQNQSKCLPYKFSPWPLLVLNSLKTYKNTSNKGTQMGSSSIQCSKQFELDCHFLNCYFSGNGTINKEKLVEIFVNRNSNALKVIRQTYGSLYGQDLLHVMISNPRNSPFARAAYLRMSEPQERDAEIIRHSLFGGDVNLNTLTEVTCTRTSPELHCIKQVYRQRYDSDLEQDVTKRINGGFKEILLAVLKSSGHYGGKVEMSMALCDAKTFYEAIESGKTIDQKTILSVMSQRNSAQLRAILVSYKQLYGHQFSKSIKRSNKCGQFGRELGIVIRCIQFPEKFFAKQLKLMHADSREILIRIITTRCEIDIREVDTVFAAKTGSSLEKIVRKEFTKINNDDVVAAILVGLLKTC